MVIGDLVPGLLETQVVDALDKRPLQQHRHLGLFCLLDYFIGRENDELPFPFVEFFEVFFHVGPLVVAFYPVFLDDHFHVGDVGLEFFQLVGHLLLLAPLLVGLLTPPVLLLLLLLALLLPVGLLREWLDILRVGTEHMHLLVHVERHVVFVHGPVLLFHVGVVDQGILEHGEVFGLGQVLQGEVVEGQVALAEQGALVGRHHYLVQVFVGLIHQVGRGFRDVLLAGRQGLGTL